MIKTLLAATAAAVMSFPSAANAIPSGATSWIPASCAIGSFDPVSVDQGHYLLTSHMTLCTPYNSHFAYTIMLFYPGQPQAGATRDRLLRYAASGPADKTADVYLRAPLPVFALCLVRDLHTRTACTRVDTTPDGVTSTPIPADDPLVDKLMVYSDEVLPPPVDNYCGSCVAFR